MKVIALGGAGEMGQWAARTALHDPRVGQVLIADLNIDAAQRVAQALGPRAAFAQIDVRDGAALRQLLVPCDVVLNTVGPFFRFGLGILQAALDARCHYLDICDDWEPMLDMLALHTDAQAAGVCAVVGMGASPGLSNLAAVKAAAALDSVHSLVTGWSLDGVAASTGEAFKQHAGPARHRAPNAATLHGVHQMSGRIRAFHQGRFADVRPLQLMHIDYPGLGRHKVWSVGHPEPITLPHTVAGLRECANVMFTGAPSAAGLKALMAMVDHGWVSAGRAARWLDRLASMGTQALPQPWAAMPQPDLRTLPPLFALATGERAGQAASAAVAFTAGPAGGVGAVTGVPLAIGASMLTDGGFACPGVFSAEAAFEPDAFFAALLPFCEPRLRSVSELALLSTSWQAPSLAEAIGAIQRTARQCQPVS